MLLKHLGSYTTVFLLGGILWAGSVSAAPEPEPKVAPMDFSNLGDLDGGEIFSQICATCHGPVGEGKVDLKAPSIAGMPAYYLLIQLANFREGRRGTVTAEGDLHGAQMRGIALALGEEPAERVAIHIEKMEEVPTVSAVEGDSEAGKVAYAERCMACHRFNGRGEIVFKSPPLTSLSDWYLAEQLLAFRDGRRGTTEGDESGQKMRVATDGIEDSTIRDIVAYIGEMAAGREPARNRSIWK